MPATARRAPARGHAGARRAPAYHPRRVSGPVARPLPAPAGVPYRRGSTGAFERLRALPDLRVVDRLLRGRAWIWVIGLMLGGIVAMQVSLLRLNSVISERVEQAATLERVNAGLETQVARLSSGERIQAVATAEGMVAPPAGDVEYVTVRPDRDARLATDRMTSPSDEAEQVMANGGKALPELAPATIAPVAGTPVIEAPDPAAAAVASDPAAAGVAPAPTATPAPVVTPAPTVAPPGATTAPTG